MCARERPTPGAVGRRVRGWAVVGVDPVAVGVALLAKGVLGVLDTDAAAIRCRQHCALQIVWRFRSLAGCSNRRVSLSLSHPGSQHHNERILQLGANDGRRNDI